MNLKISAKPREYKVFVAKTAWTIIPGCFANSCKGRGLGKKQPMG
jgi:hypothetical protein